ncbi:MAG: hypothetical protein V9G29_19425 [Burkholderiaceae bacterium]
MLLGQRKEYRTRAARAGAVAGRAGGKGGHQRSHRAAARVGRADHGPDGLSIESIAGVLGEPAQAFLQGAAQKASRRAPATPAPAVLVARAPRSRMETLVELAAEQPRPEPVRVGKERVPALTVKEYQDLFTAHAVHVGARFWVEGAGHTAARDARAGGVRRARVALRRNGAVRRRADPRAGRGAGGHGARPHGR